jgi:hypothetical protein
VELREGAKDCLESSGLHDKIEELPSIFMCGEEACKILLIVRNFCHHQDAGLLMDWAVE